MNTALILEALKWIGIVLLAGFIGQFGKSIALHLLEKWRKRKTKGQKSEKHKESGEILSTLEKVKNQAKIDKEKAKAYKKMMKAKSKSEKKKTDQK